MTSRLQCVATNATTGIANRPTNNWLRVSDLLHKAMEKDDEEDDDDLRVVLEEMEIDDWILNRFYGSSSEEEEDEKKERSANKERDFQEAYNRMVRFYFSGRESVYNERDFERRFRVPRVAFNRIHDNLMGKDPFVQKEDATKKKGSKTPLDQKICSAYTVYTQGSRIQARLTAVADEIAVKDSSRTSQLLSNSIPGLSSEFSLQTLQRIF